MNILVVGASRGIGLEFVRQYREDGNSVTATARDNAGLARLRELGAEARALDIADDNCGSVLAAGVHGAAFDVVIVCAGVGSPPDALEAPTALEFDRIMHTNVLGPMRILQPISDVLAPGAKLVFLSSVMGSIGSRSASGKWLYRASKAALNSVLKDTSLVLGERATCIAMHPGWVRTDMGGAGADITVSDSVSGMRNVIASSRVEDTGSFRDHMGAAIAW